MVGGDEERERVSVNAQTDVFRSVKYVQNVQKFRWDSREQHRVDVKRPFDEFLY